MLRYIAHRLLMAAVTIFFITIITFVIIQLPPGDFADAYIAQLAASGSAVSAAEAENLRREFGLDDPIFIQYVKWIGKILVGNFGYSMEWRRPVWDILSDRLWLTLAVSVSALLITWLIAIPVGIYSAVRKYSVGDYIFTFLGFIGLAVPNFLLALIMLYIGFRYFGTSVGGLFSPEYEQAPWSLAKVLDLLAHLVLPAFILAMAGTAQLIRLMRANLLDELRQPYVVTARAKGLTAMRVLVKYPVRASLNPFVSSMAYVFPQLISGSIIVALVLGLPTVGPVLLRALVAQDMYLAGAIVLLLGVLTVIGTFISDLLLMWLDPRIRFQVTQ
ncbi:ABC transporter permease [Devosia sp. YIM 151766]|uniref:ABC transporter permease n=1 Tax=Devosia sp. YIM 151766 TaxID=3017325 RepID=UPI00255CE832|nr:ABC transporter permease [Devosia sp. YIM 151766]WIY52744.1 ABC transporter permease [Devosia sp. YIM 151766]